MMRIALLGPTTVSVDGTTYDDNELGGVKPRQLLELLALHLGTPMSKDLLADTLWEGEPPSSYVATVESYVCGLRRRLGTGHGHGAALATSTRGYVLRPEMVEVDVVEVRGLLADPRVDQVAEGLGLLTGDLLASDPYPAWSGLAREAFSADVALACSAAASLANMDGRHALAARLARAAVEHNSWCEAAWRELMLAEWRTGDPAAAVHSFHALRERMREDLGMEPGTETRARYLRVLQGGAATGGPDDRDELRMVLGVLRRILENERGSLRGEPAVAEVHRLLGLRVG